MADYSVGKYWDDATSTWKDLSLYSVSGSTITGFPIVWNAEEKIKGAEVVTLSNGKPGIIRPENTYSTDSYDFGYKDIDYKTVLKDLVENGIILYYIDTNSKTHYIIFTDMSAQQVNVDGEIQYKITVSVSETQIPS